MTKRLSGRIIKPAAVVLQNKKAALGLFMLIVLGFIAVFAPLIAPYGYEIMKTGPNLAKPSAAHWMGTDNFGRDIFSRIVFGTRVSFGISFLVMCISFVVGTPLGLIAGYFGGKADAVISSCANTILSFPWVLMALAVTAVIGPGTKVVIVSLSITNSAPLIRLVRSIAMSLRERDFISAAIAVGETRSSILWRYIFPNITAPIVVSCTLTMQAAYILGGEVIVEKVFAIPGLGQLILSAIEKRDYPLIQGCVLTIALIVVVINLITDLLYAVIDPRIRYVNSDKRRLSAGAI
jgi:peptide/nickel transport system permease protein